MAYWQATRDDAFMRNEGLTLLVETATFWMGRATEINGRPEIHDVIGPDEYTEHVNNNLHQLSGLVQRGQRMSVYVDV